MLTRALAISLLFAGCAEDQAARIARSESNLSSGNTVHFFVDRDAASAREDGTVRAPYRTITKALDHAREARYGCPAKGIAPSDARIVIHVRAAATPYIGSFDPASFDPTKSSFDPTLEKLPLLVNVSGLELNGGGELAVDEGALPVDMVLGSAPTLRAARQQSPKQYLMLIHRSIPLPGCGFPDGIQMVGDGVSIRGFSFDGQAADLRKGLFPSAAIGIDRVADFDVVGNKFTNSANAIWTSQASGRITGNLAIANTTLGFIVNAGSALHPAKVRVSGNRANGNTELGLGLGGAGETEDLRRDLDLGANAFANVSIPPLDRSSNPEAIPDTLEALVTDNEFSGHNLAGIRLSAYYKFPYRTLLPSQEEAAHIIADFRSNTCRNNNHGLVADAGFSIRASLQPDPRRWTGTMTLNLSSNDLSENRIGPAFFDLMAYQPSLNIAQGIILAANSPREYLRDSVYDVTGDLTDFDYDNRAVDPTDGSPTHSVLRVNGVEYGGATGRAPEVCIFGCAP